MWTEFNDAVHAMEGADATEGSDVEETSPGAEDAQRILVLLCATELLQPDTTLFLVSKSIAKFASRPNIKVRKHCPKVIGQISRE